MSGPIRVLVVHPRLIVRAGLAAMLAKTGIQIVGEAEHASEAIALAKKDRPDVAIVDLTVSDGDGFDLLKRLRKSTPDIRLVPMTAIENPTYLARAKAIGAADFITEAVSRPELVATIQRAASGEESPRLVAKSADPPQLHGLPLTPRERQVLGQIVGQL